MPPKKRFSAFDDFSIPAEEQAQHPPKVSPSSFPPPDDRQVERIERLRPSQMMPDRFQPRRLLPQSIRTAFFSGQIDCYAAAARWLEMGRSDPGVEAEVSRLLSMGLSFDEFGQIKPVTGSWVAGADGRYIFQIETGERRFWAACLQRVQKNLPDEPLLRVEVVPQPTRQRQVVENRHAEPPSAVEQACEIASLILAELGVQPDPQQKDEFEYFRLATAQRMPAGLWERITPIMQLTRPRMVQLLNILQLPSPLLELADRYRLPERVLREVLSLPPETWERALKNSIQHQLTAEQVASMADNGVPEGENPRRRGPGEPASPAELGLRSLRRFTRVLDELDDRSRSKAIDSMANTLIVSGQAEALLDLLEELQKRVQARLSRR